MCATFQCHRKMHGCSDFASQLIHTSKYCAANELVIEGQNPFKVPLNHRNHGKQIIRIEIAIQSLFNEKY